MGFIFQPLAISQQYFCSLKTNPKLLLATELWWVLAEQSSAGRLDMH